MSLSKHTEAEMIGALKQLEAGRKAEDVAREVGVSKHTIYAWKAKYGGMEVSQAQEVKQLRDENARLKKLVANLSLDKDVLQWVIEKKAGDHSPEGDCGASAGAVRLPPAASVRSAGVGRDDVRYQSLRRDEPLRTKLVELAREKPRFGYRRLPVLLRRSGEHVNHKRLHRIYREAGLTIRRKKRKHCVREGKPLVCGLRPIRSGRWTSYTTRWRVPHDPSAERGRCLHAGMFVHGSRHQLRQPPGDASIVAWDTARRKSLRRRRPQVSTQLN
jgi:putative transposase